jgi:glycosyltransferase involved in cell wall biosynthesis
MFVDGDSHHEKTLRSRAMRDFSLILATVSRTSELNRLFDSLLIQTFHDFEVIVVDQNSDDRLMPILHRARCLGLAIRHLRFSPPNLALARNAGIAASSGQWLGFPDDDCWYEPHTLERIRLRSRRSDHPQGIISHWVEQDPAISPGVLSWQRSSRFRDIPVSSITLFLQRHLIERIGGFDGRLGVGQWFGAGEETDVTLRALSLGALIAHEPTARVHHRADPPQVALTSKALNHARLRARGTGAMYAKHRLPLWVIARGLLSPLIKPLCRGHMGHELRHGYAIARGRLDGWLGWWMHHCRQGRTSLSDGGQG